MNSISGRDCPGGASVHDDSQELKAGHARPELVDGDDALRVARKELLDLAPQMRVELACPHRGRRGQQECDQPDGSSVLDGPLDELA